MKYMITNYVVNPHESEDGVRILPISGIMIECMDDETILESACRYLTLRPFYWAVSVLKRVETDLTWQAVAYIPNPAYDPAEQARRFKAETKEIKLNVKK